MSSNLAVYRLTTYLLVNKSDDTNVHNLLSIVPGEEQLLFFPSTLVYEQQHPSSHLPSVALDRKDYPVTLGYKRHR